MPSAVHTSSQAGWLRPGVISQVLKPMAWLLRTDDESATMNRLFTSQHVTDLRLIVAFSLSMVILAFVIGGMATVGNQFYSRANPALQQSWVAAAGGFLKAFGAVLTVFGAVLAWVYQTGSARLGVVDLFACEIDTLCRVTLVVEAVRHSVDEFDQFSPAPHARAPREMGIHFTSEEEYFPVFQNNTKDLKALEAKVVKNITAFYTYLKAVRDARRALAEPADTAQSESSKRAAAAAKVEAARNLIYMLFLGLESARKATIDLVEYEPDKAERSIVILISELQAYGFLFGRFAERDEKGIFYQRLALRLNDYKRDVPALMGLVRDGAADKLGPGFPPPCKWEQAGKLLDELNRVFKAATGPIDPKTHAAGA